MDPAEKATMWAQAISEGLNCVGVFLCRPALAKARAEAPGLLRRWESEYAPMFRQLDNPGSSGVHRAMLRSALAAISSLATAGVDLDDPEHVASLRGAIRKLLAAFGIRPPGVPADEAGACELHGEACPALAEGDPS